MFTQNLGGESFQKWNTRALEYSLEGKPASFSKTEPTRWKGRLSPFPESSPEFDAPRAASAWSLPTAASCPQLPSMNHECPVCPQTQSAGLLLATGWNPCLLPPGTPLSSVTASTSSLTPQDLWVTNPWLLSRYPHPPPGKHHAAPHAMPSATQLRPLCLHPAWLFS